MRGSVGNSGNQKGWRLSRPFWLLPDCRKFWLDILPKKARFFLLTMYMVETVKTLYTT